MGWLNKTASAVWGAGQWFGSFGRREPQNAVDIASLLLNSLGYTSKAGVTVSSETALRVTDVLACVRVLAEGVAQCPIKVMKKDANGNRQEATDHPLNDVLSVSPNEWDTGFTLRETLMYHAVMTPGAFGFINRVRGTIREIIPIPPGRVSFDPNRSREDAYKVATDAGLESFSPDEIFHFTGPRWDARSGLDIIGLSRDAIGLAIALEASHSAMHKNGLRPSIALLHEKGQTEEQLRRVKALLKITHGGVDNQFKPLFLDAGWKLEKLSMSGTDAQHIETRLHQLRAICRALRVFPQMVGDSDKTSTYASAEQFFIAHVVHSLLPWVERFEQTANKRLLTTEERKAGYYVKIFTEGLLRGDSRARAAFYQVMVLTGIFTRNECRELEDRNRIDGLDDPLVPLNMGVAGAVDGGVGADGKPLPALSMPNVPIVPMSAMMGHNGGPPLDDALQAALQAQIPALEASGNRRAVAQAKALLARQNVGRVLSSNNEELIRGARDNLDTVLDKLDAGSGEEE